MAGTRRLTLDVCVIGGGPAGSTIARQLARFGCDVCVVDRDCHRPQHIAASLPSGVLPLLDCIGVRDRVEGAGFLPSEHVLLSWAERMPTLRRHPVPGLHVDRTEFDRLLLANAAQAGVRVMQPAQAMQPERASTGGWNIRLRQGPVEEIHSKIVVDASGGRGVLSGRWSRHSPALMALSARWATDTGACSDGRVEAGEEEWYWCAPSRAGQVVVSVFLDPGRLSASNRPSIRDLYLALVKRFRLFSDLGSASLAGTVQTCDATSRSAEDAAGLDFVRVGDSNFRLDPLSSQGVLAAIASGIQAAPVVNTLLRHPGNRSAAVAFHKERQRERVRQHSVKTAGFYRERAAVCNRPFWCDRGAATIDAEPNPPPVETQLLDGSCRIRLSNGALLEEAPTLREDIIESAMVLRHQALERPLAYLDDIAIVPLLRQITSGRSAETVVQLWSARLPQERSWQILRWLWQRRIVVPTT